MLLEESYEFYVNEEPKIYKVTRSRTGRLNPLNDYLFKQYMGTEECKECLISFLNAVLDMELTDVEILENLELFKDVPEGKYSRLDIRAKLADRTHINIEVQLLNEDNIIERSQYYNGRLFISGIKQGDEYKKLGKVISINLLNFDYLPYPEFHISGRFRVDQHPIEVLSDKQEIHFIELKRFYREKKWDIKNPLHRWLRYFDRNLEEDELEELIRMDGAIAKAEERTKRVSASEKELRYYEALEDARRNMISSHSYYREQGFKDGEARGKVEGKVEGKAEEGIRFAELVNRLMQDNQMEELQQILNNPELREEYYKEYNLS